MTVRLAMWSGPRNISTALMRSWENRPDCLVVDEPLYAYYLQQTQLDHPGREEVIAAGETDWRTVVAGLGGPWPGGPAVHYQKHMTHHLIPQLPREWITTLRNVLLIRDPAEVLASYIQARASVVATDIGLVQQNELYDLLGGEVPVLDAADFLQSPEAYLRWLCDYVGVDFDASMLSWPAGPRPSDGVWAKYWYAAVQASTGFASYQRREVQLDGAARAAELQCRPYFDRLYAFRVRL